MKNAAFIPYCGTPPPMLPNVPSVNCWDWRRANGALKTREYYGFLQALQARVWLTYRPPQPFAVSFERQQKHFLDCLDTGEAPRTTAIDAMETLKVLNELYEHGYHPK
jgi:hypothetical protein